MHDSLALGFLTANISNKEIDLSSDRMTGKWCRLSSGRFCNGCSCKLWESLILFVQSLFSTIEDLQM